MKRFTFRLDSILKLRSREEEAARGILERCLSAQLNAERALDSANLDLDRCEQKLTEQRAGKSSIQDLLILLDAVRLQREHCVSIAARVTAATRAAEAQRQIFLTARRKHQAVLRLRDRQGRAHAEAEQRREENEISDFIISRHVPTESRSCA